MGSGADWALNPHSYLYLELCVWEPCMHKRQSFFSALNLHIFGDLNFQNKTLRMLETGNFWNPHPIKKQIQNPTISWFQGSLHVLPWDSVPILFNILNSSTFNLQHLSFIYYSSPLQSSFNTSEIDCPVGGYNSSPRFLHFPQAIWR